MRLKVWKTKPIFSRRRTEVCEGAEAGGVHAVDEDAAAGGLVDAADQVEQGRFAAAAGAGDGEEFAAIDGEAEAVEGGNGAVVEGKTAGDLLDADEWRPLRSSDAFLSQSYSGAYLLLRGR